VDVNFCWWNLKNFKKQIDLVQNKYLDTICDIIINKKITLFGFGEIDLSFLQRLTTMLNAKTHYYKYHFIESLNNHPKILCDIGFIYQESIINADSLKNIIQIHGDKTIRLAGQTKLTINKTNIVLFLIHWHSQRNDYTIREEIGSLFYQHLLAPYNSKKKSTQIILMGDFNFEPFSRPLSTGILGSRDRCLCINNRSYFYNPFWRKMGAIKIYNGTELDQKYGTYYFSKKGETTSWYTYDQAFFSGNFLSNGKWILQENKLTILENKNINDLFFTIKKCDHLPIFFQINSRRKQ